MDQSSPKPNLFVARDAELARLHGFIEQSMNGGGSVCFVTGEPGAGKSSLLEEFSRQTLDEYPELVFASGDCNPQTGIIDPYLPFREIMSDLTGAEESQTDRPDDAGSSSRFFQAAARMLSEHGPDLIDIFVPGGALVTRLGAQAASKFREHQHGKTSRAAGNILQTDGDLEQTHLLEQYTNVILALAEKQPLMLLLDDLHWADEASIDLLFHLSRRLGSARVLIIGAYRANEIKLGRNGDRHPLEATLNELKRYHGDIWIDLEDLQADTKRHFVDQVLNAECNVDDEAFRSALFNRTNGHALFTVEMVQYLKQAGYLRLNTQGQWEVSPELRWDGLPARVEGVISERISRLQAEHKELLAASSIIGESFAAEILAGMLKLDFREVIRALSGPLSKTHDLVRAEGFERKADRRMSVYGFRHNLIHRFFYLSLDEIERGLLHEEAALVMEAFFAEDSSVVAVQLARHFSKAGVVDKSVKYLLLAAHQARSAYAIKEALAHCQKALDILDGSADGEFEKLWVRGIKTEIFTLLGKLSEVSGEFESARQYFEKALEMIAESERLSRAGLLRQIATSYERQHQHKTALEVLDQAATLLPENPDMVDDAQITEWISIHNQQLWIHYWQGNTSEMTILIRDTEDTVVSRGNNAQQRQFYKAVAGLENRLSRFAPTGKTLDTCNMTLAAIDDSDSLREQADVTFNAGFMHLHAGDHQRASELIMQSLELARRCGDRTTQARCLAYLTIVKRKLGDVENVEKYLSETQEICEALQMREYVAVVLANRSWIAWKTGRLEDAIKLGEEALDNWQKHSPGYPFKWLALMQLIDMANSNTGQEKAIEYTNISLDRKNAKLIGGVEAAFQEAVGSYSDDIPERIAASLANALGLAKKAGYL